MRIHQITKNNLPFVLTLEQNFNSLRKLSRVADIIPAVHRLPFTGLGLLECLRNSAVNPPRILLLIFLVPKYNAMTDVAASLLSEI
jgi:hypothetical protein